ncbi:MAG: hypothetical protein KDB22_03015 [Planctomycetales bacterium]|nr:hypothetical protein [Planctomycetales bacterium]
MQTIVLWGTLLATGLVAASLWAQDSKTAVDDSQKNALELAQQGQALVRVGEPKKAIELLTQAVESAPKSAELRNQLALAYFHADQLPQMWQQLREGAKIDPGHEQIAKGLLSYWRMFDKQGLFNTGVPITTVREVLGEPDHDVKKNGNEDQGRIVYGFLAVDHRGGLVHESLDLRGLTPEHFNPQETITVELDGRGWKASYRTNNKFTATAEYTLPGEQVQDWTELVSIQRLHHRALGAPGVRGIAQGMMASLRKTNPEAQYNVITEDDASILLEWSTEGNENTQAQHEIVRLFKAQRDIHRIAYVKKSSRLSSGQRQRWIDLLSAAKLEAVAAVAKTAETPASSPTSVGSRELAAWEYGSQLSAAAIMHFRGADAEKTQAVFQRAKVVGISLGIDPPAFDGQSSGNDALDAANCMQYCSATAGVPAFQRLYAVGGKPLAALLEVAIKSNLLTLIYAPNESTSGAIATAIRERAPDAGLSADLWLPVVEMVEANRDRADVLKQVLSMHDAVRQHLSK